MGGPVLYRFRGLEKSILGTVKKEFKRSNIAFNISLD